MGTTAGGLTPKSGGGFMDKYFAFDSFERFTKDVKVRDHSKYNPSDAKTTSYECIKLVTSYRPSTEELN